MSVAERAVLSPPAPEGTGEEVVAQRRWPWWIGLAVVLAAALGLRVWGVKQGLPFAYNADENAHFVPNAIGLFGHGWDPHYFVNPPAYTYLLHVVFDVWFGGRAGVSKALATNPTEVFVVARLTAAAVGTLAVWLLYLAGAKLFGRAVGLLAAALLACSFLAVFYSHLALNDVPTLAPIALSLWGTAGVLREGRLRDYLLAGVGLGLACATKYTGGIVLLPLVAAGAIRLAAPAGRNAAARGLVLAGIVALGAFVVANPYAVLDLAAFRDGLQHQADAADDALGKLGLTQSSGHLYYLWTFTWGLGWAPLVAARRRPRPAGRRRPARAARARPGADPLRALHGHPGALLRALAAAGLPDRLPAERLRDRPAHPARRPGACRRSDPRLRCWAPCSCSGQGIVYSLHSAMTLSRADTRNETRAWLVDNVPANTRIVVEPVVPDAWASDIGRPNPGTANGARWSKFPTSRSNIADDGSVHPGAGTDRQHRGLRAHALSRADRQVRREGLLLGGGRLDPARARRGAAADRAAGDRLLPRARAALDARLRGVALPQGRQAGEVQLRLDLRLLPAGLRASRAGDADLPP